MSKPRTTNKATAKAAVMRAKFRPKVERDKRKYHRPSEKEVPTNEAGN